MQCFRGELEPLKLMIFRERKSKKSLGGEDDIDRGEVILIDKNDKNKRFALCLRLDYFLIS